MSEVKSLWFIYTTKTGNKYPLEFGYKISKVDDLVYDPARVWKACSTGCSNFNNAGGCPPRSPLLKTFTRKDDIAWIIFSRFWSKYKHSKVNESKNPAIHWKFQDSILSSLLAQLGYELSLELECSFLSTGYCRGCPGKKCSFKLGVEECRNPLKRTYSMEATGINVVETIKELFGYDLYWYKKGFTEVPYMLKCITILPPVTKKNLLGMELLKNTLSSLEPLQFIDDNQI